MTRRDTPSAKAKRSRAPRTPVDLFARTFFPYATGQSRTVIASGQRFVYYTTAETAARILQSQQVWMRSTATMADYSEVEHGFACLHEAIRSSTGARLLAALDSCFSGISKKVIEHFDAWLPEIRRNTYIACVSEHLDEEDDHGRLSMWRAYGGSGGVALVLNGAPFFMDSQAANVFAFPVAYWLPPRVEHELGLVAARVEKARDRLVTRGREAVMGQFFHMLRSAVVCTKHPAFREEREWRLIACPRMYSSPLLAAGVEIVRGTPQPVQKLCLRNLPEHNITGISLHDLLDRVMIGPCEHPGAVANALCTLLTEAGVPDPESRVKYSEIPLRVN